MKLLEEIHKYLKENLGMNDGEIKELDSSTVTLAKEIAIYAHKDQYRENGEFYVEHPLKCLELYDRFLRIIPNDYYSVDKERLTELEIPFDGVQEVCLLHDVLEDTAVTIEEIAEIYSDFGHKEYFEKYMREPLLLITRDKNIPYNEYINIVLKNPISSMVKLMDMSDNSNVLGLSLLDEKKKERSKRYIECAKIINDKYRFIEKANEYRKR